MGKKAWEVKLSWGKTKYRSNNATQKVCNECGKWRAEKHFLNNGENIICEKCYVPSDDYSSGY